MGEKTTGLSSTDPGPAYGYLDYVFDFGDPDTAAGEQRARALALPAASVAAAAKRIWDAADVRGATAYWMSRIRGEPVSRESVGPADEAAIAGGAAMAGAAVGAGIYSIPFLLGSLPGSILISLLVHFSALELFSLSSGDSFLKIASRKYLDAAQYIGRFFVEDMGEPSRHEQMKVAAGKHQGAARHIDGIGVHIGGIGASDYLDNMIAKGMGFWNEFRRKGSSAIKWDEYLLSLEYSKGLLDGVDFGTGLVDLMERFRAIEKGAGRQAISEEYPRKKMTEAQRALFSSPLRYYKSSQALLPLLLKGDGGNCEAETKFLLGVFSALEREGIDIGMPGYTRGIQYFGDHVRFVFYNERENLLFDPMSNSYERGLREHLYDPHSLLLASLRGLGQTDLDAPPSLIMAPRNADVKLPSKKSRSGSNTFLDTSFAKPVSDFWAGPVPEKAILVFNEESETIEIHGVDANEEVAADEDRSGIDIESIIESFETGDYVSLLLVPLEGHLLLLSRFMEVYEKYSSLSEGVIETLGTHDPEQALRVGERYEDIKEGVGDPFLFSGFFLLLHVYLDFLRQEYQFELSPDQIMLLDDVEHKMAKLKDPLLMGEELLQALLLPETQKFLGILLDMPVSNAIVNFWHLFYSIRASIACSQEDGIQGMEQYFERAGPHASYSCVKKGVCLSKLPLTSRDKQLVKDLFGSIAFHGSALREFLEMLSGSRLAAFYDERSGVHIYEVDLVQTEGYQTIRHAERIEPQEDILVIDLDFVAKLLSGLLSFYEMDEFYDPIVKNLKKMGLLGRTLSRVDRFFEGRIEKRNGLLSRRNGHCDFSVPVLFEEDEKVLLAEWRKTLQSKMYVPSAHAFDESKDLEELASSPARNAFDLALKTVLARFQVYIVSSFGEIKSWKPIVICHGDLTEKRYFLTPQEAAMLRKITDLEIKFAIDEKAFQGREDGDDRLSPEGAAAMKRILYIREYLDFSWLLRGWDDRNPSPLDGLGIDLLRKEAWGPALDRELGKLSEKDRRTFIDIFGLEDGSGNPLAPRGLDGSVISDQILVDKRSTVDMERALKIIDSSPIENKKALRALLYIREFLDYDAWLKDEYGSFPSPLDREGIELVNNEDWTTVLGRELANLTERDKAAVIRMFDLRSASGRPLEPEHFRARILSKQLLTDKYSSRDLVRAVCGVDPGEPFCASLP